MDWIIRPKSDSVGEFKFGQKISEVFEVLKKKKNLFPQCHFFYNEMDPFSMPLIIRLVNYSVDFHFNSKSQRLESIHFNDMKKVCLLYNKGTESPTPFSFPEKIATLGVIYNNFGPTKQGQSEDNYSKHLLEYPGLVFVFEVPEEYRKNLELLGSTQNILNNLKLELLSYRSQNHLYDYPENCVEVVVGVGINVKKENGSEFNQILFGDSVQRVVTALGLPQRKYSKREDAMNIERDSFADFSSNKSSFRDRYQTIIEFNPANPDYFFNYFSLGIDILFDGTDHTVKKFILWTNLPSQPHFITYDKCHYEIDFIKDDHIKEKEAKNESNDEIDVSLDKNKSCHTLITPEMKWNQLKKICGKPIGEFPYFSSYGGIAFDEVVFNVYDNIIFEVLKKNTYVSKVYLFQFYN